MRIYSLNHRGEEILAVETDNGLVNLTRALEMRAGVRGESIAFAANLASLLSATDSPFPLISDALRFVEEHNFRERLAIPRRSRPMPPVRAPSKVIGLAYNYRAGSADAGRPPAWFLKAPSAIIGDGEKIVLPEESEKTVFAAELGVVIGRRGRKIKSRDAMDYVFGYTVVNDVTALDILEKDLSDSGSWMRAKSFDSFLPMGPCILSADEAPRPEALEIVSRINGRECQRGSVANLTLGIPEIIETVSRWVTLEPGDVIATGAPPGAEPMASGDTVECEVVQIGVLSNPVEKEKWFTRGDLDTGFD